MFELLSSFTAHCLQHVYGSVLNNCRQRSRKESLSGMKVISKVSDSGTAATVYYSYSFRHFSFADTKQTRHSERTKWERGGENAGTCSAVCECMFACVRVGTLTAGMSFFGFLKVVEKDFLFFFVDGFHLAPKWFAMQISQFASGKWDSIEVSDLDWIAKWCNSQNL